MSAVSGGSLTSHTEVKFAGAESKDKMYEPKQKKKLFRVLTVCAYLLSVSLPAITFSLFYIFIYDPLNPALHTQPTSKDPSLTLSPDEGTRASLVQLVDIKTQEVDDEMSYDTKINEDADDNREKLSRRKRKIYRGF